ncbi:hypothetical protein ACJX0J_006264, partial [Zea mays]
DRSVIQESTSERISAGITFLVFHVYEYLLVLTTTIAALSRTRYLCYSKYYWLWDLLDVVKKTHYLMHFMQHCEGGGLLDIFSNTHARILLLDHAHCCCMPHTLLGHTYILSTCYLGVLFDALSGGTSDT